MKYTIITICLLLLTSKVIAQNCQAGQNVIYSTPFNQCNNNPWVLVFEDNFNGSNLDLSKWNYSDTRIRYCNSEQQYYTHSNNNTQVSNGTLKIIAKKETLYAKVDDNEQNLNAPLYCNGNYRGKNGRYFYYTSDNIETNRKFSNGKFEASVKIPKGKGLWPAFWTYGQNPIYNEIDIFEFMNEYNVFHVYDATQLSKVHRMTLHHDYDADGSVSHCGTAYTGTDFSQEFHTFTMILDNDKIEWYVDGALKRRDCRYYTMGGQETGCTIEADTLYVKKLIYPQDPMNIIFDLAIQGFLDDNGNEVPDGYGNLSSPDASTTFPCQMEVEWIRYYRKIPNPCQDVTITNASQFSIDSQLLNAMVGRNVAINCLFTVPSGQQLDIVAGNSVTLGPGFTAAFGSTFNVRIESTVCN
ncbi:MAG: glycoside hydrolase family 16 protein [Bacteroidales bacterium]